MPSVEIIRAAVINYLLNRNDANDLLYIQAHRNDELYSFEETFNCFTNSSKVLGPCIKSKAILFSNSEYEVIH